MQATRRRTTRVSTALITAAGLLALEPAAAAEDGSLLIEQTALGNVFLDDQRPRFELSAGADSLQWEVLDLRGAVVARGESEEGHTDLVLPELSEGYYRLDVSAAADAAPAAEASNSFAVVDSWDGARDVKFGMHGGFGLPAPGQEPVWDPQLGDYSSQGVPDYGLDLVPLLRQTGAGTARDTIAWNQFEPEKKLYTAPDSYDAYIDAFHASGVEPLVVLSYGNKVYDVDDQGIGAAPYTEEGIRGYAEYARAVLSRYEGKVGAVEVWNEYNGDAPWNRGPCRLDARCYFEMLKVTHEVVKQTHPEAEVVGPAAVTLPYGWLEELFSYGALEYLDAVTVHPYGIPNSPENGYGGPNLPGRGLDARIAQLDSLIRQYNAQESKPIWFTEIGWGSHGGFRGVSELDHANYLLRSSVMAYANGVDRVYWHSLRNSKVLPDGPGANWGLVRAAGDPLGTYAAKKSYPTYATMTRQLSHADFQAQDASPDGVRSYHFRRADDAASDVRVMWAPGPPGRSGGQQDVALRTDSALAVTDMDGAESFYHPHRGFVHLTLTGSPLYVEGDVQRVDDGFGVSMQGPDTADVGSDIPLTLAVESRGGRAAEPVRFRVDDRPPVVLVSRGGGAASRDVTAAGGVEPGVRTVVAEISIRGVTAGRLAVDVAVE